MQIIEKKATYTNDSSTNNATIIANVKITHAGGDEMQLMLCSPNAGAMECS